jgi:hypothetical protein
LRKNQILNGQIQIASILNQNASQLHSAAANDLLELEAKGQMFYSPAKRVGNRNIVTDEKLSTLMLAKKKSGIILSNDDFKKYLTSHYKEYKEVIEEKVLMYTLVEDMFLPVDDPLGKNGPNLENFVRFETIVNDTYLKNCPYKKKCTFGTKCKYIHPERNQTQLPQSLKSPYGYDISQMVIITKFYSTRLNSIILFLFCLFVCFLD